MMLFGSYNGHILTYTNEWRDRRIIDFHKIFYTALGNSLIVHHMIDVNIVTNILQWLLFSTAVCRARTETWSNTKITNVLIFALKDSPILVNTSCQVLIKNNE